MVPKTTKKCTNCGLCAQKCPTAAIHKDDVTVTDSKQCISCMRCLTACPQEARKVNGAMTAMAALAIRKACSIRKECQLFL